MGLPLFVPPVESDLQPKSATSCPLDPARTRSPIRRADRRRQLHETRERRLRMLDALQASEYSSARRPRSGLQPPSTTQSNSRPADAQRLSERQSPRLENPRISELTRHLELERRYLGRATTELSRVFTINPVDDHRFNSSTNGTQAPADWPSPPQHTLFDTSPPVTTQVLPVVPLSARSSFRRESDRENEGTRYRRRGNMERLRELQAELRHMEATNISPSHRLLLHGLGDRDRSLSPESEGVWDTLQSTLTPDPQPPSVGSSFASTVVSATTPQTDGANSVDTSMTTPNEEIEPPCDPGADNSGSDGEEDEEHPIEPSRQPTPHGRRSYADVLAEPQSRQSLEPADSSDPTREWLLDMHRIVRGLASRVDIPDEWWASAGLSRSISWEDTQ